MSRRLRQLTNAGPVRRTDDGYALTQAGLDPHPLVFGWPAGAGGRAAVLNGR